MCRSVRFLIGSILALGFGTGTLDAASARNLVFAGAQPGTGVVIGNRDATIALGNPANPPSSDPAKALDRQQGVTPVGTRLAQAQPEPKPGDKAPPANGQLLAHAPIASFLPSISGWLVNISLPEPATAMAYRIGDNGEFKDNGLTDLFDPRTGAPKPNPMFTLPKKTPASIIEVRYRKADGTDAGPFPIRFDPNVALFEFQHRALELIKGTWVGFDKSGGSVNFTMLIVYRCAITQARYGLNGAPPLTPLNLPVCDNDPFSGLPKNAKIGLKVPSGTKSISVQLTYRDGSQSDVNTFEKD